METAAYVGEQVRDTIQILKPCGTESTRRQLLSIVAAAAPPRLDARDSSGMIRRVADFFDMRRGKRSKKQGHRPYIFDRAVDLSTAFNTAARQLLGPLGLLFIEAQRVLTHNGPAEISRFTTSGGVIVTYRSGDTYADNFVLMHQFLYSICHSNG